MSKSEMIAIVGALLIAQGAVRISAILLVGNDLWPAAAEGVLATIVGMVLWFRNTPPNPSKD